MNPDKTEEKLLISSFACSPESADLEFAFTREEGKKNVMDSNRQIMMRPDIKLPQPFASWSNSL